MKKMVMLCGIMLAMLNLSANPKPKAEAHFRVTEDLPKLLTGAVLWYDGIFSVTNTGDIAFVVVTDKEWSGETILFYREGTEEQQRLEDEYRGGKRWREQMRKAAIDDFYICVEKNKAMTTLQPGESISFECRCVFKHQLGAPASLHKAEMYLGHDTWVPVHITSILGVLHPTAWGKDGKAAGDFYYSKMGTNQYLYVKVDDKFKRVGEMKLGARPEKEKDEDAVTFVSPDGATKKLTRDQARQIVHEREQQNQ